MSIVEKIVNKELTEAKKEIQEQLMDFAKEEIESLKESVLVEHGYSKIDEMKKMKEEDDMDDDDDEKKDDDKDMDDDDKEEDEDEDEDKE